MRQALHAADRAVGRVQRQCNEKFFLGGQDPCGEAEISCPVDLVQQLAIIFPNDIQWMFCHYQLLYSDQAGAPARARIILTSSTNTP